LIPLAEALGSRSQRIVAAGILPLLLQGYLYIGRQAVKEFAAAGIVGKQFLKRGVVCHVDHLNRYRARFRGKPYSPVCRAGKERIVLPLVKVCKKCRSEVEPEEICPLCGSKLPKSSLTLTFDRNHTPVKDWFCWNNLLRIVLPASLLLIGAVLLAEWAAGGGEAVLKLLGGSFLPIVAALLCILLLGVYIMLCMQGREQVHYAMDKVGIHAWTYLEEPTQAQLYARFLTPEAIQRLETDERALPGLVLIRHQYLPWKQIRRAHFWKENAALLLYSPAWWQAMTVYCPYGEIPAVEQMVKAHVKPKKSRMGKPAAGGKKSR
jgi:hypothetical protein